VRSAESGTVPATAGEMEPGQPIEPETAPAGPSKSEKTVGAMCLLRGLELTCAQWLPAKFVILEALSATGLRSIRYAKEIPLVE
jgi:tRNA G26 N,N-dimethylase Trm1